MADYIYKHLDFDQLILEYHNPEEANSGWVHCSYKNTNNRKEYLRAFRGPGGKTVYEKTHTADWEPSPSEIMDQYSQKGV